MLVNPHMRGVWPYAMLTEKAKVSTHCSKERIAIYLMKFLGEQLYKNEIGIYKIRNIITDAAYYGQTAENFQRRYWLHRWTLRNGSHCNAHLQKSWNKYGEDAFEFSVVEVLPADHLDEREKYWIALQRESGRCYNIQDGGQPATIAVLSPETRKHIGELNRQRMLGTKLSEETRTKMSASRKGRHIKKVTDQMTDEQATNAKRSLMDGASIKETAAVVGVDYKTINNLLSSDTYKHVVVPGWHEFQEQRPKKRHGVTEDEIKQLNELYCSGVSVNTICMALNMTRATVRKYIERTA